MRKTAVLAVLVLGLSSVAAAPQPDSVAPQAVPHSIAMFLDELSNDGRREVTFKASAVGMRFFFEEPAGVTVYRFKNGRYVREAFVHNANLTSAMTLYASR
jgi:hypothetical protein